MKVCIVYPPYWFVENQPNVEAIADHYGVYPNLSLAYVASALEHAGHSVRFIDANALRLSKEQIVARVKRYQPDIMAFTINTYMIHQALKWINYIKEHVPVPVIVGGAHLSLYPKETFDAHKTFDYGIIGEAEETAIELLDNLEKGKDLHEVDSIIFRDENGKTVINGKGRKMKDLDGLPFPARHLLPNDKYFEVITQRKNFTIMATSRGCPYSCIYCESRLSKFRGRSAVDVADEIEECYHDYDVREIDIFDPLFTTQKKRVMEICAELQSRKLDVDWAVRSRVDRIDAEMVKEMKKAGCARIYYGIETGSQELMDKLQKGVNKDQVRKAISVTKKAGINAFGYFMIGLPGETMASIQKTIDFSRELNLDYAQFSKVTALPGTEMYTGLLLPELNGEDYWKKFITDEKAQQTLDRPQCDLSEEVIQKAVKRAYQGFYFRPHYMVKALRRTRSMEEFKRNAKAALALLKFTPGKTSAQLKAEASETAEASA
jgi:anaerobic magnesium-protoporphyrin IX monomethyl ester cyclase